LGVGKTENKDTECNKCKQHRPRANGSGRHGPLESKTVIGHRVAASCLPEPIRSVSD